jgi:hypothetical protein
MSDSTLTLLEPVVFYDSIFGLDTIAVSFRAIVNYSVSEYSLSVNATDELHSYGIFP